MIDRSLPPRVRRLFRVPWRSAARVERDVDEELRFHVEMRAADLETAGLSRDEALAEARRQFGDADDVRRHALTVSIGNRYRASLREVFVGLMQDFRFAMRQIRRAPLFAAVAVLTLGLGIGANSAIFSVVHHLVLAPLPYRDGDRMVELMQTVAGGNIFIPTTEAQVEAWRARARSLDGITTVEQLQYTIGRGTDRERVEAAAMAPNLANFLGVHALLGRDFIEADTRAGAGPVTILGYGLWQRRFGGRSDAVGQTIIVDDTARTVVGVAPPGFAVPMSENEPIALWTPFVPSPTQVNFVTFAKLRRGVTANDASRELTTIANALSDRTNPYALHQTARAMRPQDFLGEGYQRALLLLFGAVGLVLLIACANVANLLLVRSWGRQREFAVRTALGAGRMRLARQLLTESLALAVAGGALGLVLAWGGLHAFRALRPAGLEDLDGVHVERAVLAWTATIAIATGVVFGLFPTLFAVGRPAADWLRAGMRSAGGARGARRLRGALVIGEIALSVVLLVGAGLLARSLRAMQQVDLGFDPRGLAAFTVRLPRDVPRALAPELFAELLSRVRTVPSVEGAELASDTPPDMGVTFGEIETDVGAPRTPIKVSGFTMVQPGFFNLARVPLRGRTFSGDTTGHADGLNEAVINETFARRLFPNGDALGHRIRNGPKAQWVTIVGIAKDVDAPGHTGDRWGLQFYFPVQTNFPVSTFMLRSAAPIDVLAPRLRKVAAQVDARLEIARTRSADTDIAALLAGPRFAMALLGVLALAALVLSAIGLYGVIAYAVSQRTREIGVRVALGAEPGDIGRLIVRDGALLALVGLTIGLAGAVAASRLVQRFLYGIAATDPPTYIAIALLLGGVGLLASYLPARRAMRVDPVIALSAE